VHGVEYIRTLFNTHWHPEQTGSNIALRQQGATISAHENTRLWLSTDIARRWENRTFRPMPKEGLPNKTFFGSEPKGNSLTVASFNGNSETVQYGYLLQAHTDGDLYVFFPKSNVLAIGDIISGQGWPLYRLVDRRLDQRHRSAASISY
jgi:cyclase